jgi:hypothetical protein
MHQSATSIRPFIGAVDFNLSRNFYKSIGFMESVISSNLMYFAISKKLGFYLQDAFVKDWVDNTMLFVEVDDVQKYWEQMKSLELPQKYTSVRLSEIKVQEWGSEFYLHDPAGILWHFGNFS